MDANGQLVPVAQYLRMSTEHQQYSIEYQRAAIAQFVSANGMQVVQTFEDNGRSGLTLRGRPALQALLREILSPQRLFECVVVYDVSRWGRFQDIDESAFYEHICRRAGARVLYCAELFDDVPGPMGIVMKSVKRAMAAEYSRELSAKVLASMVVLAHRGYYTGGPPGFGFKRVQVAENGDLCGDLAPGERKSRIGDHVVLAPGDPIDCGLVRLIFYLCGHVGLNEREIALQLNWSCYPSRYGLMPWRSYNVRGLLRNEKYIGTLVYGERTQRLNTTMRRVPKSQQIRVERTLEKIVTLREFNAAQKVIGERKTRRKWTNTELLQIIRRLNAERGFFQGSMLQKLEGGPSISLYEVRFGSLANACEVAKIEMTKLARFCARRRKQRHTHKIKTIEWLAEHYRALGRTFYCHTRSSQASLDGLLSISVRVLLPLDDHGGPVWNVCGPRGVKPHASIFLRVSEDDEVLDYFVVLGSEKRKARISCNGVTADWLDNCRCATRAAVIERLDSTRSSTRRPVPQTHLDAEARRRRRANSTRRRCEPQLFLSVRDSS